MSEWSNYERLSCAATSHTIPTIKIQNTVELVNVEIKAAEDECTHERRLNMKLLSSKILHRYMYLGSIRAPHTVRNNEVSMCVAMYSRVLTLIE